MTPPSRLGKPGWLWYAGDVTTEAAIATGLRLYREKFESDPVAVYCGDNLDGYAGELPAYHDYSLRGHYFWFKYPEDFEFRR